MIDSQTVTLEVATPDTAPVLANQLEPYLHDRGEQCALRLQRRRKIDGREPRALLHTLKGVGCVLKSRRE